MGVELARNFGMTLVGFARGKRMRIYAGEERIHGYE
jgi:formate dehydrogenase assembly factor FdhD